MNLDEADIAKFQILYKTHTGMDIDFKSAREKLAKLVRQVELICEIKRKENNHDN